MITIDGNRAIELLREVVEELGDDFKYKAPSTPNGTRRCVYAHNSQPSCGVGRVLHSLGIPVEQLEALDADIDGVSADRVGHKIEGLKVTGVAAEALVAFQTEQDRGDRYKDALAAAEWAVRKIGYQENGL